MASPSSTQGIELVRAKFDPLAKKLPAHVTLVFPEPATVVTKEFLKGFSTQELPSLESVTFSSVIVHEEMYLWLVPDEEGRQKISAWQGALLSKLGEHSQGTDFVPHLTLGYIPRSITPEDAVTFAKTHITLPMTLSLEKLLLEEFAENQISAQVELIALNGISNSAPHSSTGSPSGSSSGSPSDSPPDTPPDSTSAPSQS